MSIADEIRDHMAALPPYEKEMVRRLCNGDADGDLIRRADIHRALSEQKIATLHRGLSQKDRALAQLIITDCMRAIARLPFRED